MFRKPYADVWLEILWAEGKANLTSVSNYMEGLSNAIIIVIRNEGDKLNSKSARGVVMYNLTCVGVVWAWIALPVALLFLTLVFLVRIMVMSHANVKRGGAEEGRKPWKSSAMPLL